MTTESTPPTLLRRVRDPADGQAWRQFERRYGDLVFRYCRGQGLQQADAEDIVQNVMLRLARALRTFEYSPERGRFRNYLGTVTRNVVRTWMARPDRRQRLVEIPDGAMSGDEPDTAWEAEWVRHHFRLAMKTVRETFEPASVEIFDRLLAGEPVAEVARSTGRSEQAVHKIKQRIRNRLSELIAEQVHEEEEPGV